MVEKQTPEIDDGVGERELRGNEASLGFVAVDEDGIDVVVIAATHRRHQVRTTQVRGEQVLHGDVTGSINQSSIKQSINFTDDTSPRRADSAQRCNTVTGLINQ